jgi:hypothetical protein
MASAVIALHQSSRNGKIGMVKAVAYTRRCVLKERIAGTE